jgi:hypothetical protein
MNNTEETLLHLLVGCPFVVDGWNSLNLFISAHVDLLQVLDSFKNQLRVSFFMEIIITMCWSIWTIQNDVIFRNITTSVQRCKSIFKEELRAKGKYQPHLDLWIEAYV